jgi:hypothetical protein
MHAIESADGVEVMFASKEPETQIYLAHGDWPDAPVYPDPFERIGPTPFTLRLAPGTYTIECSTPTSTTGHQRFMVERGRPLLVDVHPGSAGLKTSGAVILGLGVVATILGIVAIVSFSGNDSHYDRFAVGLPLILGGAGASGVGIVMTSVGATSVHVNRQGPGAHSSSVMPAFVWQF